jgi:DNA-binding NarL/FixJ family response regulator
VDKVRILIADDHTMVREGLRKLLQTDASIEIIDEVGDGQGAINVARKEKPDLILMDINMPGTSGLAATLIIKKELPAIKVIAITIYEDEEVVEMVKAGVSAYILKDVAGSELISTIHKVMAGEVVIHPRVAHRLIKELVRNENKKDEIKLTRREKDVLDLLVQGSSNRNIANIMFISEKTVKNHLTSIFRKLDVKDRTQAAVYAIRNHMVEVP